MNAIARGLAQENGKRTRLGEGEPGLMTLLGGFSPDLGSSFGAGRGGGGSFSRLAKIRKDVRLSGGTTTGSTTGGVSTGPHHNPKGGPDA